jgi:hypothetical protein
VVAKPTMSVKMANMDTAYRERFDRTVKRLLAETYNLMSVRAALEALDEALRSRKLQNNRFLNTALSSLLSDQLIRLIRIFENDKGVATFWYLYNCEPTNVGEGVDINRLRTFSEKITVIRNKSFVHIDKKFVFNPDQAYKDAGVTHGEIVWAIETVWPLLNRLHNATTDERFPKSDSTLDEFREGFRRAVGQLNATTSRTSPD